MTTIERIISLKSKRGMSDAEFERRIGIPEKTFYSWKSGRSKTYNDMLPKIASVLDVTASFLLGESDDPAPTTKAAASIADGKSYADLTPEALEELDNYADYLREKYKKK